MQNLETSTVLIVSGEKGSGKSFFAEKMARQLGGRMLIFNPKTEGEEFPSRVDWDDVDCACVENISNWDSVTTKAGIEKLESDAKNLGKKVLILTRERFDLKENLGIEFQEPPANIEMPVETEDFSRWVGVPFVAKVADLN